MDKNKTLGVVISGVIGGVIAGISTVSDFRENNRNASRRNHEAFKSLCKIWNENEDGGYEKIPTELILNYERAAQTAIRTGRRKDTRIFADRMKDILDWEDRQIRDPKVRMELYKKRLTEMPLLTVYT